MKKLISIILLLTAATAWAQHGRYVGGDISLLPAYEDSKTVYLDKENKAIPDLITWAVETCGWNAFRIRLFVNPDNSNCEGLFQDIDYVKKVGKRIKDAGAAFMLDIHYSDTWADPSKQHTPSAWSDCTTPAAKAERLYNYTKDVLMTLIDYGAEPDLVQVGNEITAGIVDVWRYSTRDDYYMIVEKGCKAVREVCPKAKIVIHIDHPENTSNVITYYSLLDKSMFDVIGLSYYPFWHGTLKQLGNTLSSIQSNFPTKKVQIVETAYNFQYSFDHPSSEQACVWPISKEGQQAFMKALIDTLSHHANVDGLYYWCPEEAGNGDAANWTSKQGVVIGSWMNRGLWDSKNSTKAAGTTNVWGHALNNNVPYMMRDFLNPDIVGIAEIAAENTAKGISGTFSITGQPAGTGTKGILIRNGKKYIR